MFHSGLVQCFAQQNIEYAAEDYLSDVAGNAGSGSDKVPGDDAFVEIVAAGAEQEGGQNCQVIVLAKEGGGFPCEEAGGQCLDDQCCGAHIE